MIWLPRTLTRVALAPGHADALAAYQREARPDLTTSPGNLRLVVIDVETTGLRPHRDKLLAIGGVSLRGKLLRLDDMFETTLRQDVPSAPENILVHGIDGTTQTCGTEVAEGLVQFLQFVRADPLIAFHADFDRVFVERAMRASLGIVPSNVWLDLADLAPALYPEHAEHAQTLDHWMGIFEIDNPARHDALADAVATAQLLQILLARAEQANADTFAKLLSRAKEHRWLAHSLRTH